MQIFLGFVKWKLLYNMLAVAEMRLLATTQKPQSSMKSLRSFWK